MASFCPGYVNGIFEKMTLPRLITGMWILSARFREELRNGQKTASLEDPEPLNEVSVFP